MRQLVVIVVALLLLLVAPSRQQSTLLQPWEDCVATAPKLLQALNRTETTVILLEGPIRVTAEDLLEHLPIRIVSNRIVHLLPIPALLGTLVPLDFGGALRLLYLEPNSGIRFQNVELSSVAHPTSGPAAGLATEVQGSPLWSAVDGGPAHQVYLEEVLVRSLRATCTPEHTQALASRFHAAMASNGTIPHGMIKHTDDAVAAVGNVTLVEAVTDAVTKAPVGTALYHYTNATIMCQEEPTLEPVAEAEAAPASGSSSSWLWPVVGALLGLATAAAVAGGWLLWRRRTAAATIAATAVKVAASEGEEEEEKDSMAGTLAELDIEAGRSSGSDIGSIGATLWRAREGAIDGLELGELLGRGSFGSCYRGRWKGAVVAAKVIETQIKGGSSYDLSREPLLSASVSHPNVITTFKLSVVCVRRAAVTDSARESLADASSVESGMLDSGNAAPSRRCSNEASQATREAAALHSADDACSAEPQSPFGRVGAAGTGGAGQGLTMKKLEAHSEPDGSNADMIKEVVSIKDALSPGQYETWMLMEYADRGNLSEAIASGKFINAVTQQLELVSVLLSLLDIGQGMEYLHDMNIVHGDLKGANVLLKSARNDRRGFVCKIADFGLSRMLGGGQTHVGTRSFGTATHAAPELLHSQRLSKAADVYAYSMLMWEMVAGEEAYADMNALQIIMQVSEHGLRPQVPGSCPAPLAQLMQRCWHSDPQQRPTFIEVVAELRVILRDCRTALERLSAPPQPPYLRGA